MDPDDPSRKVQYSFVPCYNPPDPVDGSVPSNPSHRLLILAAGITCPRPEVCDHCDVWDKVIKLGLWTVRTSE
jgi:hypothetical protein